MELLHRVILQARHMALIRPLLAGWMLLLPLPLTVAYAGNGAAQSVGHISGEHLTYDIVYHWGIIWKRAAQGTLSIERQSDSYRAVMTACTLPFADRLFKVRDTLVAEMRIVDLQPQSFVKIAREGKFYQIDSLTYSYTNDSTSGYTVLTRPDKEYREVVPMTVEGDAYDMLSIFYRVRQLPFYNMKAGDVFSKPIFSGRNIEQLDIEYLGTDTIEVMEKPCAAYYLQFRFYDRQGKRTSDRISAWLSVDDYIPLQLEGKLPVGSMKVMLVSRR